MALYSGGESLINKFAMLGLYKTHKSENTNLLIGLSQLSVFISAVLYRRAKTANQLYEKYRLDWEQQ